MIKEINYQKCTACSYPIDLALDTFIVDLDAPITGKVERSPCQTGCPAGVNIPGFIYMLRQGRPEQAISLLREALPLPAITGHVCFHPCETVCARNEVDEALNINALERFTADYWLEEKAPTFPKLHEHRVAIAGSGPAGLSAAYYMAKLGYPVTVFEAMPATGGMLRYGIPEYRL
ncbi:MAG: NAD(P)-binding protein, partial [Dehalococcoidia bacterium]|nr:NAD(P)-binding protein [Dehalococcoidia bacterium]